MSRTDERFIRFLGDHCGADRRILLRKEPEGGYTAIVPTLPGCITYGDTIEEAIDMAREAIEGYLESLMAHGEEIPTEKDLIE